MVDLGPINENSPDLTEEVKPKDTYKSREELKGYLSTEDSEKSRGCGTM